MNFLNVTATAILIFSSTAAADPVVNGNVISWPDDGWYQVQLNNEDGVIDICEGETSCTVGQGNYIVINHTTGQRFEDIEVNSMPASEVSVSGTTISWPDNGWYQVQSSDTYESICSGTTSCRVPPGSYLVVNHTTGERFEDILVGIVIAPITVSGNTISWPDDGWFQVQTSETYESVCNGGRSCDVLNGAYTVINHSTGELYRNVQVPAAGQSTGIVNFREIISGDLAFTESLTFTLPRFQVIRTFEELNNLYYGSLIDSSCEDCEFAGLPFVNFEESTVVLAAHEIVNSGGYGINIESISPEKDRLIIKVVKKSPGDSCPVSAAFTGPYKLIQIDGIHENVEFIERSVQDSPC